MQKNIIFYDGYCGLCHRWVKFVLPRDSDGSKFIFSPLQGDTFAQSISEETRATLPDSIILKTADEKLLTKSDAVLHIFQQLGNGWVFLAGLSRLVPRPVRDSVYDLVASVRHKLFKKPDEACPLMPPEMRSRFKM